jgi:dipeptidyl aminopeptidase/acylaminoacyl peptidase
VVVINWEMAVQFSIRGMGWRMAVAACALWASMIGAAAAAEPLPVADFFRRPQFVHMVMSPNGQSIAATAAAPNGRVKLVVLDLRDLARSKTIAFFSDADVYDVEWVNDDRLVFDVTDRRLAYGDQKGSGLFAVDREGKEAPRALIQREWRVMEATRITDRALTPVHSFHSVLRDGSADVLVVRRAYSHASEPQGTVLYRLDTRTGQLTSLSQGTPEHVFDWTPDAKGVARAIVTQWADRTALHWRSSADAQWTRIQEAEAYGNALLDPLFAAGPDSFFAIGRAGADTAALLRVEVRDGKPTSQPLLALDGYDFTGALIRDRKGAVLGVSYLTDARGTYWFDASMAQIQKQVDALLPATNNRLDCGDCVQPAQVLVTSTSDRQPGAFRLFDVKAGKLSDIAVSRPWIKPEAMAQRELVRVAARDGLSIPVHITRPPGVKGPAPMVVLVHGGPYLRGGEWRWYGESQFLASRGYVVVEPEFRGSRGFGEKLYRAGFKQWGLAMQDDIADATQWAIKQGHADANRVCIAGASYGGYATLMGLIRYPELYRCGFEWVGVTDIELMYSIHWSDFSGMWKDYGMPVMVGDRVKDAEQLAATSPLKLAAKLRQPLLMAYGGEDKRVPIDHGLKMRDALRPHNPNVEWISYANEGHGWMLQANDIDFWTRVEKFLDKQLKSAP